jgi:hypothetical protein
MHPIDEAILNNSLTNALLQEHAALPLPEPHTSYWGDCMRQYRDAWLAAGAASVQIKSAMASLAKVL